jgi:hypothetical protein
MIISLLHHYAIPAGKSDRWSVRMDEKGVVMGRHTHYGLQEPWDCTWEVAVSLPENGWQAEIKIPFKGLDAEETPQEGSRWRMKAALYDLNISEDVPITVWGTDDLNAVEQGAILVFARK